MRVLIVSGFHGNADGTRHANGLLINAATHTLQYNQSNRWAKLECVAPEVLGLSPVHSFITCSLVLVSS